MINKLMMAATIIASRVSAGFDLETELSSYVCPAGLGPLTAGERDEVRSLVINTLQYERARATAEVEDPALIVDPEGHEDWYDDWLNENNNNPDIRYYWLRLNHYLGNVLREKYPPEEAGTIVRSIDNASDMIIRRLESPERTEFRTKGLVLGHVQSGKTANFTAVIAKAADAGYKLIVVLTGIHNNLRSQTQLRLDRELTGEPDRPGLTHVGAPVLAHRKWVRMTNYDYDFDQRTNMSRLEVLAGLPNPMLLVMKKNCSVMRRFIQWVDDAPDEVRSGISLLLIDDEADQASIDTNYSRDRNTDPTATNELIRTILSGFSKHAYVGYTATPFANVLIDMSTNHNHLGRDLYPRNFIVSLPRPEEYIGAEQIFSNGQSDHYVRIVPNDELPNLVPRNSRTARSVPRQVTPTLERALLTFCLSAAARLERGHADKPMTMLIHTTHLQNGHHRMKSIVEPYCTSIKTRWEDQFEKPELRQQFENLWNSDFIPTTEALGYPERIKNFEEIEPFLDVFLQQLQVFELNASAEDELDYSRHPEIKVVAIGGNRLSRGLTLEGLMTSFYLRRSQAYDTLLQMGRWFGYRQGYEDLTRVFTSRELVDNFEDLALVEQELRQEIQRYEDEELTPAQMAVRIRSHQTMKITARNKMGAGIVTQGSFSGRLAQTIWFPLAQPQLLRDNLQNGERFVREINTGWRKINGSYLASGVPGDNVIQFLENYHFVTNQTGLDSAGMISYIRRHLDGELRIWNVGVVGQAQPQPVNNVSVPFGGLRDGIIPVRRSRQRGTTYKTGVLSSPGDLVIDLPRGETNPHNRTNPLLLLYLVWKDSSPRTRQRLEPLFEGLNEKVDVLGIVIVFPESISEPSSYIAQPDGGDRLNGMG